MFRHKLTAKNQERVPAREGDLYTRIEYMGRTFEIYYGYYEECDRHNPLVDPVPIYPDFMRYPQYDSEGRPFSTEMQDACERYLGDSPDDGCFACKYYRRAVDRIGVCACRERRRE